MAVRNSQESVSELIGQMDTVKGSRRVFEGRKSQQEKIGHFSDFIFCIKKNTLVLKNLSFLEVVFKWVDLGLSLPKEVVNRRKIRSRKKIKSKIISCLNFLKK